ncbi:hypothetical protein HJC23_006341 [Cyclotella cryptica]|uniref:Uncharacterized protein n=1 Tax=Cyclotella cryptica TaxID=29204 RepID=A0ABD3Q435_9STRA
MFVTPPKKETAFVVRHRQARNVVRRHTCSMYRLRFLRVSVSSKTPDNRIQSEEPSRQQEIPFQHEYKTIRGWTLLTASVPFCRNSGERHHLMDQVSFDDDKRRR